jgi:hypothetical protein
LSVSYGVDSYRVCELLYEQRREYDRILHCYLRDPLRKPQVFSYLRNILLLYTSATDRAKVEVQIVDSIQVTESHSTPLLFITAADRGKVEMESVDSIQVTESHSAPFLLTADTDRGKVETKISDHNISLSLCNFVLSVNLFAFLHIFLFYQFLSACLLHLFVSFKLLYFPSVIFCTLGVTLVCVACTF